MKCQQCGGALEGTMTSCPYCGVRQEIDLRQIHFRDCGPDASMKCPACDSALSIVEIDTQPVFRIERCACCHGMFFNPGELPSLLDRQTHELVWLDKVRMDQISAESGGRRGEVYRKCPICPERMSPIHFAGRSGVVLDRCGIHGLWLDGGEFRQLVEWWSAGGKLVYQQYEVDKARQIFARKPEPRRPSAGTIESPQEKPSDWSWPGQGGGWLDSWDLIAILAGLAKMIMD